MVGTRLGGADLGLATNGADAHSLGVLSMIAALDSGFETFVFNHYQGNDSLLSARDSFRKSVALRPEHYWSNLALGQIEYLIASRLETPTWEDFEPAALALSHCITLEANRCFARADRSTIYRIQAKLLAADARADRTELASERLRWAMDDVEVAMQSAASHPWVGWQAGLVAAATGRTNEAIDQFINTAMQTYPLIDIFDATLLQVDDLRGRAEAAEWLETRIKAQAESLERARMRIALAGIRLNQFRSADALRECEQALQVAPDDVQGYSIRGILLLRAGKWADAKADFTAVLETEPSHPWATFGLAECQEHQGQLTDAIESYRRAESFATTDENRSAAMLGRCRCAAITGDLLQAKAAIIAAIELEPACDVMTVVKPLTRKLVQRRSDPMQQKEAEALAAFLKMVAQMPRATKVEALGKDESTKTNASLLNGGFELGSRKYWAFEQQDDGPESARASVVIQDQLSHQGQYALRWTQLNSTSRVGLTQTISLEVGKEYQIQFWAKTKLKSGSVTLVGADRRVVLTVSGQDRDWHRVTGSIQLRANDRIGDGTIVPYQLRLLGRFAGTLWLDELSVHQQ